MQRRAQRGVALWRIVIAAHAGIRVRRFLASRVRGCDGTREKFVLALHLLILAIIQGVTQLFPISSLGHGILVPAVLHRPIDRQAPWFLPYIVVLHLGTTAALFFG